MGRGVRGREGGERKRGADIFNWILDLKTEQNSLQMDIYAYS